MKKQFSKAQARGGFTLVELSIGALILTIVGGIGYSILTSSTTLLAKNVSLNSSNTTLRTVLDRIYLEISQANGMPKLITPGGVSSAIGPAAGVVFDRYLGGPYCRDQPRLQRPLGCGPERPDQARDDCSRLAANSAA